MIYFQGQEQELLNRKPFSKIISVVPSQTELLFDLGLTDEVIGITKFCVHPNEWFKNKTRIGGTKELDIEKIKSLQPELVLANEEENLQSEIESISSFTDVYVSRIKTLPDALNMISAVGELVGKKEKASQLIQQIDNAFDALSKTKNNTLLTAAYLIWNDPMMTVGGDTFISDMMGRAGFENIFKNQLRYPQITMEQLQQLQPQFLLLSSEPFPFKEKHQQHFQNLLPHTKVILVDGEMFSWYGSRMLLTAPYFNQLFYF